MEVNRVGGVHWLALFLLTGLTASFSLGTFWESTFQKVPTNSNVEIIPLNLSWSNEDLLGCAAHCLKLKDVCYSFTFDFRTTACELGSGLLPSQFSQSVSTADMYYTGASCNGSANFTLLIVHELPYCLFLSLEKLDYASANLACSARGAHLYTLKEPVKLEVLTKFLINVNDSWVGLDDRDQEGVFRWLDDKTLLTSEMKNFLFKSPQPDDSGGNEDCVQYTNYIYPLNDRRCTYTSPFVCEVNPWTGH